MKRNRVGKVPFPNQFAIPRAAHSRAVCGPLPGIYLPPRRCLHIRGGRYMPGVSRKKLHNRNFLLCSFLCCYIMSID